MIKTDAADGERGTGETEGRAVPRADEAPSQATPSGAEAAAGNGRRPNHWREVWDNRPPFLATVEDTRKSVLNILILVAIVLAVPMLYGVITTKAVIIHDIAVPSQLSDRGLSGSVISQRLMDQLAEITAIAATKRAHADITGSSVESQLPDVQLPVGGISLAPALSQIRRRLGYNDVKISGEITVEQLAANGQPALYGMRLRSAGSGVIYESSEPSSDVAQLVRDAAAEIMHQFDPVNLGYYYYRKKDYQNAFRMTETALSDDTPGDDGWAFNMRGLIARDLGNDREAVRDFREAIKREPTFTVAYHNLSQTLRSQGQLREAADVARKAIEIAPKDRYGYSDLALALIEEGDAGEALKLMKRAVEAEPRAHDAYFNLGIVQHKLRQWEEAAKSYERSTEIKPDFAEGYSHLSRTLYDAGKRDDAIEQAQRAIDTAPKSPDPWILMGIYEIDRGNLAHALSYFNKAVSLDSAAVEAYQGIGTVMMKLGRPEQALASFNKAEELAPRNARAIVDSARALAALGRRPEAEERLRSALQVDPRNARVHAGLGRLLLASGNFPGAADELRTAVRLEPSLEGELGPLLKQMVGDPAGAMRSAVTPEIIARAVGPLPVPIPAAAIASGEGAGMEKRGGRSFTVLPVPASPTTVGEAAKAGAASAPPGPGAAAPAAELQAPVAGSAPLPAR